MQDITQRDSKRNSIASRKHLEILRTKMSKSFFHFAMPAVLNLLNGVHLQKEERAVI